MAMSDDGDLEKVLGPLEADVMRIVWKSDAPITVRALLERINLDRRPPLAYTTIMTVTSRLVEKDILSRRLEGRGYLYQATVSDPAEIAVRDVMRDFGDAAVAHFVDEVKGDRKALRRLRRMLAESEES